METGESFGDLLTRYRNEWGWSQAELAEKAQVSRGSITQWENERFSGRRPRSRGEIQRLAEALQLAKEERNTFFKAAALKIEQGPIALWNVPHRQNPFFTGREMVLEALRHNLASGKKSTALPQAISGLGGIGKTQVAVEYAHRYAKEYEAVLWLQADSSEAFIVSCLQLATEVLALPEQQEIDKQVEAVKRWLATHSGWLLVLDNVEEPLSMVEDLLPSKHGGSVIVTTRLRDLGLLAHSEVLPVFSRYEGALLLLRRARRLGRQAALRKTTLTNLRLAKLLNTLLGGLPLALDQAGAYIAENGASLQKYIELYQQAQPTLLDRRTSNEHPESVLKTFWLSWEQIQKRNAFAGQMLLFCAFLAPDQIPELLVFTGVVSPETEDRPEAIEMDEALGLLYRYSLIDRREQLLSIHRLVQEVIQVSLSEDEQKHWRERVIFVINYYFPDGDYGTWPQCEVLLPHALVCTHWIEKVKQMKMETVQLFNKTGYYLYQRAQYAKAEPLLQQTLTFAKELVGPTHSDTAIALNNLAALYRDQGRYQEAEPLLQQALSIYGQQVGPDHPDTAQSLNNLAALYRDQGRYQEAEPLLQQALAIYEQQTEPIHPDSIQILNNLAMLYRDQGRDQEAEPLLQRVLKIHEGLVGSTHLDTAQSLNNLAALYQNQGRDQEAEPLLQQALAIYGQQVGPDHPDTARCLNNLAMLYCVQERYQEAEPLLQQALAIYEQQLDSTHPMIQTIQNYYAITLQYLKDHDLKASDNEIL